MSSGFDDSDDFEGALAAPTGGWRRVFLLAIERYKGAGLALFITGILATLFEVAAYGTLLGVISNIDTSSSATSGFPALPLPNIGLSNIVIAAAAFLLFMAASALLYYAQGIQLARYRRISFSDMIESTLAKLIRFPDSYYPLSLGKRGMARALRRECRYVSRAVTDVLMLPQPAIVLLTTLTLGILFYPEIVGIAALLALLSVPLHIAVGQWGSQTMRSLIERGAAKSEADRQKVEKLLLSMDLHNREDSMQAAAQEHVADERVSSFLNAYGRRMMLSPVSLLVSRLSALLIISAVGLYITQQHLEGQFNLAEIALVIIGFRMASGALSQLTQSIVVIASYSPLIGHLLDFLYQRDSSSLTNLSSIPLIPEDGQPLPRRFFWIGGPDIERSIVLRINSVLSTSQNQPAIISSQTAEPVGDSDTNELRDWLEAGTLPFSKDLINEVLDACSSGMAASDRGCAMLSFWQIHKKSPQANLFWDSKSFVNLGRDNQEAVLERLNERSLCVYHVSIPKRLSSFLDGNIFRLDNGIIRRVDPDIKPAATPKQQGAQTQNTTQGREAQQ
ncbi:MAG: ABC transporter ATP-binding protein [Alphaproteobacteria bacterium]|nr:ABC transporter ATP-binding protein [Alphaproteobacteria bacterium]